MLYTVPSDTHAILDAGHTLDHNHIADDLALLRARLFYLDDYGADPTGAALSDTAFTNAHAAATASIVPPVGGGGGPTGGALVMLGPGVYKFSVNTVKVTDPRIGLIGPGKQACTLYTTGNTGDLVYVTDTSPGRAGVSGSAPVGGFSLYGWNGGDGLNGLHYGDRPDGRVTDITSGGFIGNGSRCYLFRNDNGGLMEGSYVEVDAQHGTVCYDFDGGNVNGSFDYSTYILHVNSSTFSYSETLLRVINQGHLFGCDLKLRGNVTNAHAGLTATAVQIGASTSDTARIPNTAMQVEVECDNSTGTCTDLVVTGTSAAGIFGGSGLLTFLNAAGTWSAGSVGGSAVVRTWGTLQGPLFSSHGTLTALGSANAQLSTYVG
jgi:hypothetical protein